MLHDNAVYGHKLSDLTIKRSIAVDSSSHLCSLKRPSRLSDFLNERMWRWYSAKKKLIPIGVCFRARLKLAVPRHYKRFYCRCQELRLQIRLSISVSLFAFLTTNIDRRNIAYTEDLFESSQFRYQKKGPCGHSPFSCLNLMKHFDHRFEVVRRTKTTGLRGICGIEGFATWHG